MEWNLPLFLVTLSVTGRAGNSHPVGDPAVVVRTDAVELGDF
jgi:hypothetical protein